jgi:hypothetical protein
LKNQQPSNQLLCFFLTFYRTKKSSSCCAGGEVPEPVTLPKENIKHTEVKLDRSAWENDLFEEYLYPYHLKQFDNQNISMIACDKSLVGLSDSGKIITWGGPGVHKTEADDLLLASNYSLTFLEQHGIEKVLSSGSELIAIDKHGVCYINTHWGAPLLYLSPHKLLAMKVCKLKYFLYMER